LRFGALFFANVSFGNGRSARTGAIFGPAYVELHENAKRFGKVVFVVFRGDQIGPGLLVVA